MCSSKTRYLGLDYGEKTIGIALGSIDNRVATGLTTLHREQEAALRPAINRLREIVAENGITHIVLGNPVNMDGSMSPRAEKTLAFKDKLQRNFKSLNILLWDERLSTKAVTRAFYNDTHSKRNKKQKETYRAHVDEMAAVYILQGYLNHMEVTMENEHIMPEDENMGEVILVTDDDGTEHQLHVLSTKEVEDVVYLLVAVAVEEDEDDESEVLHFKCTPTDDDEEEMSLEMIDETHADFEFVMELFKNDYEELGITIDEGDPLIGEE